MVKILPLKMRLYQCKACGNKVHRETNHESDCYPNCQGKCYQVIGERKMSLQTAHKFIKS